MYVQNVYTLAKIRYINYVGDISEWFNKKNKMIQKIKLENKFNRCILEHVNRYGNYMNIKHSSENRALHVKGLVPTGLVLFSLSLEVYSLLAPSLRVNPCQFQR